jgi:hypothetical protein
MRVRNATCSDLSPQVRDDSTVVAGAGMKEPMWRRTYTGLGHCFRVWGKVRYQPRHPIFLVKVIMEVLWNT